jgi:predicted DNA-binding transcriptional regulator AlpA
MKFILFFGLLLSYPLRTADPPSSQVVYTPYEDARSVLETLVDALPAKLRDVPVEEREAIWNEWTKKRDAQIRDRLAQGDADSVMNFLMFGTSFTAEARLTSAQLQSLSEATSGVAKLDATSKWREIFEKRVEALVRGMMAPGTNERLQFAAKTLERAGIQFSDAASKDKARRYLYENVQRVLQEQAGFRQTLAAAKSLNDPTEEFAERSKLYKDRGLSLDTSLPPDYALEVALKEMSARGLLKPGSVARVGIIGPGLDFADKQEGYDFYPPQTAQPFAVMDSLLRLGLAKVKELKVDTLDLSPRVLEYVAKARGAAEKERGYMIQLPRDRARGWNTDLVAYWKRFGSQIGIPAAPVAVPAGLKRVTLRAIRVRPEFVRRMQTFDVDVVLQRVEIDPESTKFDLLIATNILVYYDTFEQSLAMTNVAAMLKPGGYLLTNNLLLELPGSPMRRYRNIPRYEPPAEAPTGELVTLKDAAKILGVAASTIHRWINDGFVAGEQITPGAPWRIRMTDELRACFVEETPPQFLPMLETTMKLGVTRQTVLQRVKRGELEAVHVRCGRRKGLRIKVVDTQPGLFQHSP